jgi:hypothetical protein
MCKLNLRYPNDLVAQTFSTMTLNMTANNVLLSGIKLSVIAPILLVIRS